MKAWIMEHKFLFFAALFILAGALYYTYFDQPGRMENQKITNIEPATSAKDEDKQEDEQPKQAEKKETIIVDVKGEINLPGVYSSNQDERVIDVIQRAGGLTDKADKSQVNFAAHVQDEMVIYVPAIGEPGPAMASTGTSTVVASNSNSAAGKININKADESQLQDLPGIGPAKAAAIIQYRQDNGPFKQAEDLKKISGIGEKTFEKLKDAVSVQ